MSAAKEREKGQGKRWVEEERTNEKEERDKGRERLRSREHIGEEERNRGRESVRKRRGSSYYKWQSLPWAYHKGFSILQGIEVPQ